MTHTCIEFSEKVTRDDCISCPLWDECVFHAPPSFGRKGAVSRVKPISMFLFSTIVLSILFII